MHTGWLASSYRSLLLQSSPELTAQVTTHLKGRGSRGSRCGGAAKCRYFYKRMLDEANIQSADNDLVDNALAPLPLQAQLAALSKQGCTASLVGCEGAACGEAATVWHLMLEEPPISSPVFKCDPLRCTPEKEAIRRCGLWTLRARMHAPVHSAPHPRWWRGDLVSGVVAASIPSHTLPGQLATTRKKQNKKVAPGLRCHHNRSSAVLSVTL